MTKAQVTVTPNEAKRIIARAVSQMPEVESALESGKLMLKGGTTVSAIAQELASRELRISGRISSLGAKRAAKIVGTHIMLIESGQAIDLDRDDILAQISSQMGEQDILITGANTIDIDRKTAIMVGRPPGTSLMNSWLGVMERGVTTIIAVGWEKLIPSTLNDALIAGRRHTIDLAMGMAVDLAPLNGTVITETDAISMLSGAKATVIGAGGIMGAEGATTFVIEGNPEQVKTAWEIVNAVKGTGTSGVSESLAECERGNRGCTESFTINKRKVIAHRSCVYREPNLASRIFRI